MIFNKGLHTTTFLLVFLIITQLKAQTSIEDTDIQLAITIDSAIYHGDGSTVDQHIDYDVFTQRVFKGLHQSSFDWKEYAEVFRQQLRLGDLLIEQIGREGEYSFVKVIEDENGNKNLLYRMIEGDGMLDYNEMLIAKNHLGQWNVVDVYFYLGGVYFSDIIGTLIALENPDLIPNKSFRKSLLKVRDLYGYNQEGMFGNTIEQYDSLSNYFKKEKTARLALIQAYAGQGGITEFEEQKALYLDDFPYDKSIRLLLMEVYGSLDNFEMAYAMNNKLSELIGGDEYLMLREAEIYLSWEKTSKAKKVLKKLLKSESFETDARLLLMDTYYIEKNYKSLLTELLKVSDMVGVTPEEILPKESYPLFYSSSYWEKWKKQQS
ncbi:tetratricopeptide repeat protein [Flammeovirga agarivorans]|uniref:Tetratricopeptide repeat-containing protein n=1 Tax=Flammeovirga agarivorans TaxID=2726742 RepID=A0A7X8SR27_9BACT|nr:hypothetical protein [Flammeovirga agarivorans]NLR94841.1 hypothetical protein [Flammeovirga agarivorans]